MGREGGEEKEPPPLKYGSDRPAADIASCRLQRPYGGWVVRENKNMESFQVRKMYQAMPSLAGMESQHWQQMKGATACKYCFSQ